MQMSGGKNLRRQPIQANMHDFLSVSEILNGLNCIEGDVGKQHQKGFVLVRRDWFVQRRHGG